MTSTRVFDHYEREYLKLTKTAMQDVELIDQLLPGVERDSTAKKAQQSIEAAEEIVESMQLEARSLAGESKQQLIAQAKDYKAGIAMLKTKLRQTQVSSRAQEAQRAELLRGSDPNLRAEADSQRARLMETNERLHRGTDKLKAATQIALETEQIGTSILGDLESQRHTLNHARGTLSGATTNLDRSARLLRVMGRRAWKNRMMMVAIIFFITLMILFIIWFKWLYHPTPPPPPCQFQGEPGSEGSYYQQDGHACPPPPPPLPSPPPHSKHG